MAGKKKVYLPAQIALFIPQQLKEVIEATAERRGLSMAELMRNALRDEFLPDEMPDVTHK